MRILLILVLGGASWLPAFSQWLAHPTPGIPRLANGTLNFSAPAPRTADGKPNLTGIWRPNGKFNANIAVDLKPGEVPLRPAAAALVKERRDNVGKDDPQSFCLPPGVPRHNTVPFPLRIFQYPDLVVILYEYGMMYRQIFTDGRALPQDPNPNWMGYSTGKWEGDTLVVETTGLNGKTWLDDSGHPLSAGARVIERFRRRDFGNLDIGITIDDPAMYTRPWSITIDTRFFPDSELLEFVCDENNKDPGHLVGK